MRECMAVLPGHRGGRKAGFHCNTCLTIDSIPTVFDSLRQSSLTWFFDVKLALNITHKYLTDLFDACIINFNSGAPCAPKARARGAP